MITDLDPLFTRTRATAQRKTPAVRAQRFGPFHQALAFHTRAEREAAFERTHGSLWTPGLLDRLSLPLSHIHE